MEDSTDTLRSLGLPPFRPLPWIKSGMAQTFASACWPYLPEKKSQTFHKISLPDRDYLSVVEDRPRSWKSGDRIVLLVHGLAGHHQSNYMVRVSQRLVQQGFHVFRVNLRGCGTGFGLARQPYHSGQSEDLRVVLRWLEQNFSKSPVTQVGFSLGANITLKMAGEDGDQPIGNLDSVVAISPPVDLAATAEHLKKTKSKIFDQFFVWKLRYDIWRLHRYFPDLPGVNLPLRMTITDIDDLYTAPRCGFKNAQDYYTRCSSGPWVSSIRVPSLILCSKDDPVIDTQSYLKLKVPPQVDLIMTDTGGHVGFFGNTGQSNDVQWMDNLITKWIKQ